MRVENSARNAFFGVASQIILSLLGFASRRVFVEVLGFEVLGINGLYTNIISMLSLTELGLGSAIIYSLYKPIADHDENKIRALLQMYSRIYMIIAGVVTALGIGVLPFLTLLVKSNLTPLYIRSVFLLFLLNTTVSYLFSYKRSIIIANQKSYVVTYLSLTFQIITVLTQIVILITTKNYILFLVLNIFLTIAVNVVISKRAEAMYPFIKRKERRRIDKKTGNEIFKNSKALMFHRIGSFFVFGTDNLLISSLLGVAIVGLVSNYTLITTTLNMSLQQIFKGATASMGHFMAKENRKNAYPVFLKLFFANFWIYGFCAICFFTLANPFITLWLGEKALLKPEVVLLLSLNFYLTGMRASIDVIRESAGLFDPDKYMPLVEAGINLVVSVILLQLLGLPGVFIGTAISTLLVPFWTQPMMIFSYIFKRGLSSYYKRYLVYALAVLFAGALTYTATVYFFPQLTLIAFIKRGILCAVLPNVIFLVLFCRTKELRYYIELVFGMIGRKILKKRA